MRATGNWSLITAIGALVVAAACASAPPKKDPVSAQVSLHSELDAERSRYRVQGAEGADEAGARKHARMSALKFAAQQLAGNPTQKTGAATYIKGNPGDVLGFAAAGKIIKRGFSDDGESMRVTIFVDITKTALERHLVEGQVITSTRDLGKAVGNPTVLVVFDGFDCSQERTKNTPYCTMPARIKEVANELAAAEAKSEQLVKTMVDKGCLDPTELKDSSEYKTSHKDKSSSSLDASRSAASQGSSSASINAKRSSSASGYKGGGETSVRGRSKASVQGSKRSSHSSSSSASVSARSQKDIETTSEGKRERSLKTASKFCRDFMNRLRPLDGEAWSVRRKMSGMQDKLMGLKAKVAKKDLATDRIARYFVDQRWNMVDKSAVENAARMQSAMTDVSGMPQDPVAALAQLVGADIYVMHGAAESHTGEGYYVTVNVKAFEVVSGKLLASNSMPSRKLANKDLGKSTREAVGKAMPKVFNQISGYWSDMAKEGLVMKVVLRGEFTNRRQKKACRNAIKQLGKWKKSISTQQTLAGLVTMPADADKDDALDDLMAGLEEAGFPNSQVIMANNALVIVDVK